MACNYPFLRLQRKTRFFSLLQVYKKLQNFSCLCKSKGGLPYPSIRTPFIIIIINYLNFILSLDALNFLIIYIGPTNRNKF
jgi:hypothetical protein